MENPLNGRKSKVASAFQFFLHNSSDLIKNRWFGNFKLIAIIAKLLIWNVRSHLNFIKVICVRVPFLKMVRR